MKIKAGQSLMDISLIATGGINGVFDIAKASGVSIDALPEEAVIPATGKIDSVVLGYYSARDIVPATGISGSDMGGIGAMGIEIDFGIS